VLRRPAALLAAALVSGSLLAALSACGSGNGQLSIHISSSDAGSGSTPYSAANPNTYAAYKPGDTASFTVAVVNNGPGTVAGVTIHVILPAGFHYHATTAIAATAATRTQPLDPAVNSNVPIFGLWSIAAPGTQGSGQASEVDVTFTADVSGSPGNEVIQAFAAGDTSSGQTNAAPYNVTLTPAAKLAALISVNPPSEQRGGTVEYQVRVTNSGTGNAQDVAVLVTLPPVMSFASSVTPFAGNGTRNLGVNPIKNTLLVYYDGFLLPPSSNAGPGYVVIVFKANVLGGRTTALLPTASGQPTPPITAPSTIPTGAYPVDVQVTDQAGDTVTLHAVAPVTVT
jgi:uncharacterized repeat protein (TIGR01451 family)